MIRLADERRPSGGVNRPVVAHRRRRRGREPLTYDGKKENLTRHLLIYEDHIRRRLTVENAALRAALEAHDGVTVIRPPAKDLGD